MPIGPLPVPPEELQVFFLHVMVARALIWSSALQHLLPLCIPHPIHQEMLAAQQTLDIAHVFRNIM